MRQLALDQVKFSSEQLIPVVVQDSQTLQVLMLAYANLEALEKTVATALLLSVPKPALAQG